MSVQVVHVKRSEYDLYIGRRNVHHGLAASPLHNPWSDRKPYPHGDNIAGFRATFMAETPHGEALRGYARTQYLLHKSQRPGEPFRLACWCAPARCHGDVIKEYWESLPERS